MNSFPSGTRSRFTQIVIVGCGKRAGMIARVAAKTACRVAVLVGEQWENREGDPGRFPKDAELIFGSPQRLLTQLPTDEETLIIAATGELEKDKAVLAACLHRRSAGLLIAQPPERREEILDEFCATGRLKPWERHKIQALPFSGNGPKNTGQIAAAILSLLLSRLQAA